MEDSPLRPGTITVFILRFLHSGVAALVLLCMVVSDCFYVFFYVSYAALGLQSAWSLSVAIVGACYAVLGGGGGRLSQSYIFLRVFVIGDLVTSTLTFVAACASAAFLALFLVNGHFSFYRRYAIGMGMLSAAEFLCWSITFLLFLPNLRRSLALLLPTEEKN